MLSGKILIVLPKIRSKGQMPALATPIQHWTSGSSQCNRQENKIKSIQIEKEELRNLYL